MALRHNPQRAVIFRRVIEINSHRQAISGSIVQHILMPRDLFIASEHFYDGKFLNQKKIFATNFFGNFEYWRMTKQL
jgi:hypothetical protein